MKGGALAISMVMALAMCGLAACGIGAGGGSSKDLFTTWHHPDTQSTIELDRAAFGSSMIFNRMKDGAVCRADAYITGTQSHGDLVVTIAWYVPATGLRDPGCAALIGAYAYTKSATSLTLCDASTCAEYH